MFSKTQNIEQTMLVTHPTWWTKKHKTISPPGIQSLWSSRQRLAARLSRGSLRPLSLSSNPSWGSLVCHFCHFVFSFVSYLCDIKYLLLSTFCTSILTWPQALFWCWKKPQQRKAAPQLEQAQDCLAWVVFIETVIVIDDTIEIVLLLSVMWNTWTMDMDG